MQSSKEQSPDKPKLTKWLLLRAAGFMLTLLAVGITIALWVVPAVVHSKVMKGLSKYWDGRVEVKSIEVNYVGPAYLRGVRLLDKAGNECIGAETIEVALANWPGIKPALTGIKIDGLKVQVSAKDGKFSLPVVLPSARTDKPKKKSSIRKFAAEKATIILDDGKGSRVVYDDVSLSVLKRADFYGVQVKGVGVEASHRLVLKGKIYPETLLTDISVQARGAVDEVEAAIVSSLLKLPGWSSHGQLTADVDITGSLTKFEALHPQGVITLADWTVEPGKDVPPEGFSTDIRFAGSSLSLENTTVRDANGLEWLSAESCVLNLADWPGRKPALTGIDVSGLRVEASLVNRKPTVPLVLPKADPERAANGGKEYPPVTFRDTLVTLADPNGRKMTFSNLAGQFTKHPDFYDVTVAYRGPADANELNAKVIFHPATSGLDLSLKSAMTIRADDMNAVLSMFRIPNLPAEGKLVADLAITGSVDKLETLRPKGFIKLKDWVKVPADGVRSDSLSTDIRLDNEKIWLENLSVRDANGFELVTVMKSRLTVENWPGPEPVLTEIAAEGLTVRPYTGDGTFCLPHGQSSDKAEAPKSKYVKLRKVDVEDAGVGIADHNDLRMAWDHLLLEPAEKDGFYDVLLTSGQPEGTGSMRLEGTVNPGSSEVAFSLDVDRVATRDETGVAFAALGMPRTSLEGKLRGELTIEGRLDKRMELQSKGNLKLDECALLIDDQMLAEQITTEVAIDGQKLGIEQFAAMLCGGKVTGSFAAEVKEQKAVEYQGKFLAVNVDFPRFTSVLTANEKKATAGKITMDYRFAGRRDGVNEANGDGLVLFDDADVSIVPVIPTIFRSLGLSQYEPLKKSDADAIFSTAGPVVTIKSGRIANPFAAIEFEPGGTIDLKAKQIDGYVVAAPLGQITGTIERLPIVSIFANVKDKLTRLRVKGQWSDPPASLIKKEPIKDIKDSTVGFVQDVVKSGGQFGQGMIDGFKGLLNKLGNNKSR